MLELWSPNRRYGLWRRLWLALAEGERSLGVAIPDEAIAQMRAHLDDIDFDAVAKYEKEFRHDVMAHVLRLRRCRAGGAAVHPPRRHQRVT